MDALEWPDDFPAWRFPRRWTSPVWLFLPNCDTLRAIILPSRDRLGPWASAEVIAVLQLPQLACRWRLPRRGHPGKFCRAMVLPSSENVSPILAADELGLQGSAPSCRLRHR